MKGIVYLIYSSCFWIKRTIGPHGRIVHMEKVIPLYSAYPHGLQMSKENIN